MGCCGQRRAQLASRSAPPARRPERPTVRPLQAAPLVADPTGAARRTGLPPSPPLVDGGMATIPLRYLANAPLRLRGPVTARVYEFSTGQQVQAVAAADAPAMLASRLFGRA